MGFLLQVPKEKRYFMIKLYSFGTAFNLADPSPFVVKVDLHLRANKIEFESIASVDNLKAAPKGKLPFIDDNGTTVSDSSFVVEHLKNQHHADIDAWLNEEQKATAHLISKSLDENFYWCIVHSRWIAQDTWPIVNKHFFGSLPFPVNKIVPIIAQRKVRSNMKGHGIGRHSHEEIIKIAQQTLQSLSALLGNKPYFFGDRISSLDICAYAMLANLTHSTFDNEMSRISKTFENLVEFTQRIKNEYYPELD